MLTDAEVGKLAESLLDTDRSVFGAAESLFGAGPGAGVVRRLEAVADLVRCPACGTWTKAADLAAEDDHDEAADVCGDCLDDEDDAFDLDEEDDDEEDDDPSYAHVMDLDDDDEDIDIDDDY